MTPLEYQKLAKRTQCPQLPIITRLCEPLEGLTDTSQHAILHASIGISGEAGEISAAIERWLWYGKGLDTVNVKEELGDLLWYIAEACNALGLDMGEVMEANIAKLRTRYPEKYSDERAAEENRDREKERKILAALGPAPEFTPFVADAEFWNNNPPNFAKSESTRFGEELALAVVQAFRRGAKLVAGAHPKYLILEFPGDVSMGWGTEWVPVTIASDFDGTGQAQTIHAPSWLPSRLEQMEEEAAQQVSQNGNGFAEPPEEEEAPSLESLATCALVADGPAGSHSALSRTEAIDILRRESTRLGLLFMKHNTWTDVYEEIRQARETKNG